MRLAFLRMIRCPDISVQLGVWLSAACLFLGCAQTQTVKKSDILPLRIINTTIAKEVKPFGNLTEPVENSRIFTSGDHLIISHVKFKHLTGEHCIRWEWYAPNGQLFLKTEDYPFKARSGNYVEEGVAHNTFNLHETNAFRYTGEWKVQIYLDKKMAGSNKFILEEDIADINFGNYHALIIGNNAYQKLIPLKTARQDAQVVAKVLAHNYNYNVHLKLDATREDILLAFEKLSQELNEKDNLLVYYAGHGYLDEKTSEGYWQPVDAVATSRINWISSSDIADNLRAMPAKHVLVVADSCYSGALIRGIRVRPQISSNDSNIQFYMNNSLRRVRTVLTSGGLEPVLDSNGDGSNLSVFAAAFLDELNGNTGILTGSELFKGLSDKVKANADQEPMYGDIRNADHQGGDFLFVRIR